MGWLEILKSVIRHWRSFRALLAVCGAGLARLHDAPGTGAEWPGNERREKLDSLQFVR
jgi:hypothetical protein